MWAFHKGAFWVRSEAGENLRFAVSTASVALMATMESTHWLTFSAEGAKLSGLEEPVAPCQLSALQPGSPSRKKVAMLKCTNAIISPCCHATWAAVGRGRACAQACKAHRNANINMSTRSVGYLVLHLVPTYY